MSSLESYSWDYSHYLFLSDKVSQLELMVQIYTDLSEGDRVTFCYCLAVHDTGSLNYFEVV